MTEIMSLAMLNGLPSAQIPSQIQAIADRNAYNPVADWILSKPWDGVDRMPDFYATVVAEKGFPVGFKEVLLRTWMLSAAAAALKKGFHNRGVLTLQGPQGIGKTSWGRALVSDPVLRDQVILVDHHLDPSNKDSLLLASANWLVELGEIDSSFKRDIARLKGYLTSPSDKIRAPYARVASEFPRRTVFYATVNAKQFLVDETGNSRWWTIPVASLDFRHQLDMQQVFAQLGVALDDGAKWWLTQEEEATLEQLNRPHRSVSVIRDTLLEHVDLEPDAQVQIKRVTPIGLLREIGFRSPSNAQARECGAILREWLGEPTKIRGEYKWPVPMRQAPAWSPHVTSDDDY